MEKCSFIPFFPWQNEYEYDSIYLRSVLSFSHNSRWSEHLLHKITSGKALSDFTGENADFLEGSLGFARLIRRVRNIKNCSECPLVASFGKQKLHFPSTCCFSSGRCYGNTNHWELEKTPSSLTDFAEWTSDLVPLLLTSWFEYFLHRTRKSWKNWRARQSSFAKDWGSTGCLLLGQPFTSWTLWAVLAAWKEIPQKLKLAQEVQDLQGMCRREPMWANPEVLIHILQLLLLLLLLSSPYSDGLGSWLN